jgi:monoamine oxidase
MPIERRTILQGMLAGSVVAAAPGKAAPSRKTQYDVIVLGGGFAGVTAARELARSGRRCIILEARGRLGGRTFSTQVFDEQADVGGQWIHWIQPHVWAEVTRYGLTLVETPGASPASVGVWTGSKLERQDPDKNGEMINAAMQELFAEARTVFPRPMDPYFNPDWAAHDSWSVQDRLDAIKVDPVAHAAITGYLTTCVNSNPKNAGYLDQLHWYARAGYDAERLLAACSQFKLSGGTTALMNRMVADAKCEVHLNTPIAVVEADAHSVSARTSDGRIFKARAMVVALPMNCWRDITWKPDLAAEKMAASHERHAGMGFELHVLIEGTPPPYEAMAAAPNPLSLVYSDRATNGNTVIVALGPSAKEFDLNDDAAVAREMHRLMPEAKVLRSFSYDWNADPYSKGTWCDYRPRMWSKYGHAMRQSEGPLIFAGSDTADGWRGFIDGAIETGLRAAREVSAKFT